MNKRLTATPIDEMFDDSLPSIIELEQAGNNRRTPEEFERLVLTKKVRKKYTYKDKK